MNPTRLARELSEFSKNAARGARRMRARGDSSGAAYNDGMEDAFTWIARELLNPDSHLMRKLREEVNP